MHYLDEIFFHFPFLQLIHLSIVEFYEDFMYNYFITCYAGKIYNWMALLSR